jgi:hypothetical protein
MKSAKSIIFLFIVVLVTNHIWATTPQLINYQGRLLDTSGEPVPDGNYELSFTIYDASTGGLAKWSETQSSVAVIDGLFNVVMGSVVPLTDDIFSEDSRYLEVSVQGQVISSRTQFTSVSYAHRIGTIDGAEAGELSGSLKISPSEFKAIGNALTVVDDNDQTVFEISVDATGSTTVSFYEPVDSKQGSVAGAKVLDISVNDMGTGTLSFYEPVDSKGEFAASALAMEMSVNDFGQGTIGFYEPADSKSGLTGESTKKVEIQDNGLIMFGATDQDTSLIVAPNGDIIGLGQITMGQNSSSGVQTSVLGFDNDASGDSSSIGGGSFNVASGEISVIGGGHANSASGTGATIGGGGQNDAIGNYATIAGGLNNMALGDFSTIPGGDENSTDGSYSYAAGHRAKAAHSGAFVWADQTEEDFMSTGPDQFLIRAGGGVGIGTNNPVGLLDVVGAGGDNSVNLPEDAISSGEMFDEPGIAANREANEIFLTQGSLSMQDVITATITIPSSGYIMVTGGAVFESYGTSKRNQAFAQIDEISGGELISPFYIMAGSGDHDSPNEIHYFPMTTQRIYYKTAGTYEFRLEAQANPANEDGAISKLLNPNITAMYFPTAYGAVDTAPSSVR